MPVWGCFLVNVNVGGAGMTIIGNKLGKTGFGA
jgi:hypothetical protein